MSEQDTSVLREKLVSDLRERGLIESDAVAAAFLRVPREAFVPQVWPGALYRDVAIGTKFSRLGRGVSSSSEPGIMARMLEMLHPEPAQNVLEVGAGTGYNAALLQELAGPRGHVTSIEYQTDVAAEAAAHLKQAGYGDVAVVGGDGALGWAGHAPFDRIIVTAACRNIPVAWWEQLKSDGVLVLPFRRGAVQAVFSLQRKEYGFEGERTAAGSFMVMQGGAGPAANLRFIGPRRDLGITPGRRLSRREEELVFRLLNSAPRENRPDILAEVFPAAAKWLPGEFWDLFVFLGTREPRLLEITPRNSIYGFRFGLAIADVKQEGLAVLPAYELRMGQRPAPDWKPRILAFGSESARQRLLDRAQEFVSLGRPGIERLRLRLTQRSSVGKGSRWEYEYSYAPTT